MTAAPTQLNDLLRRRVLVMDTIVLGAVSNVFYFVADLAGASAWYRQLLGAEPHRTTMPQLVEFDVGGVSSPCTPATSSTLVGPASEPSPTGRRPAWTVQWQSAWPEEGPCTAAPKTVFSGDRLCQVLDPFGSLLGLRQPAAEAPARP